MLGVAPLAANAAVAWGLTSAPPTTLGYSHTARSGVDNSATAIFAMTEITSSPAIPVGWMGVNARIFKSSNNALIKDAGYSFNGSVTTYYQLGTGASPAHSTYYSYGVTALYNGSGNTYTYTFRSPDRVY